jgi:hypothetical protein
LSDKVEWRIAEGGGQVAPVGTPPTKG